MNSVVGSLVTVGVLYFMFKVLGPSISFAKHGRKKVQIKRSGYHPKDPKMAELTRLRGRERRLRAELRRVQAEIKETM